jgi:hypothetical protein
MVLPALIPGMTYQGMEICDGGMAMEGYFRMCADGDSVEVEGSGRPSWNTAGWTPLGWSGCTRSSKKWFADPAIPGTEVVARGLAGKRERCPRRPDLIQFTLYCGPPPKRANNLIYSYRNPLPKVP